MLMKQLELNNCNHMSINEKQKFLIFYFERVSSFHCLKNDSYKLILNFQEEDILLWIKQVKKVLFKNELFMLDSLERSRKLVHRNNK